MRAITLRVVYLAIAALVVFLAHIVLVYAQLNLPAPTGFVVDEPELLDALSRAMLTQKLLPLEAKSSGELDVQLLQLFDQCRGSKDLNIKLSSCSFVIQYSKNKSQVERAYNSRGLANMALKNFSNAVQDFTHAMELDKTNAGYVDNRQNAFFALGQLNRALEDANHAIRLAPSAAFVYHSRAMIYDVMKLYDDAIHDLTTAISLNQNWIELLVDRGKVSAKEGRFDAAISDFNRAVERNGNLTWAFRERGLTYKRMGDKEKARSDLELVLRTEPDDNEIIEALRELQEAPTVPSSLATNLSTNAQPSPIFKPQDHRIALVIGNSKYRNAGQLTNSANDARLMADTLRSLGFNLIGGGPQIDLDKAGLDRAAQNFGRELQGADVGLFYYAGHGVQVRGSNYLVPVDANPTRESDIDFQMLDVLLVLRQMEGAGTRLNVVILDACRNNPFGRRGLRATTSGLAQMQAPEGTLISYATQPGNVALDGFGDNSPYTKALAQTIQRPGLDIFQTFNEVGLAVMQATGKAQQPWVSTSPIKGNFYFAGTAPQPILNKTQTGR